MARTKRTLMDLYVVGQEMTFDDGAGEPVTVFLRKLNTTEHERCSRRANAARSTVLAARRDPESVEHKEHTALVERYASEQLVEYLVNDERNRRRPAITAEVGGEEEWSEEQYLTGLFDAWEGGLKDDYAADPEDPESKRVFNEMTRFTAEVDKAVDAAMADYRATIEDYTDDVLRDKVRDKVFDLAANVAWLQEYRMCEVWQAVRATDKKTHYFNGRDEVDMLPSEVLEALANGYRDLSVEPTEGKSSPETDTSSPSSAQAESPETEPSSGPVDAAA